jgi:hypothetical protein
VWTESEERSGNDRMVPAPGSDPLVDDDLAAAAPAVIAVVAASFPPPTEIQEHKLGCNCVLGWGREG